MIGIGDARDRRRAVSSMEQLWRVYASVSKRELQFQSSSNGIDKVRHCLHTFACNECARDAAWCEVVRCSRVPKRGIHFQTDRCASRLFFWRVSSVCDTSYVALERVCARPVQHVGGSFVRRCSIFVQEHAFVFVHFLFGSSERSHKNVNQHNNVSFTAVACELFKLFFSRATNNIPSPSPSTNNGAGSLGSGQRPKFSVRW